MKVIFNKKNMENMAENILLSSVVPTHSLFQAMSISKNNQYFQWIFLSQCFSVAYEAVMKLAIIDQAGLKLTDIHLRLPPKCPGKNNQYSYIFGAFMCQYCTEHMT